MASDTKNQFHMSDAAVDKVMGDVQDEIYKKKYELLLGRCREIEQDNHRIAYRIYKIEQLNKETRHDKKIIKKRLDLHRDEWRAPYAERNADALEAMLPTAQHTLPRAPSPPQKIQKLRINLVKPQASTSKQAPLKQPVASSSRAPGKSQAVTKAQGGKPKSAIPAKAANRPVQNNSKASTGGKPQSLIRPPIQSQVPATKAQNRRQSSEKGGKSKAAAKDGPKPKKPKVEKDPNAPKKPANPFLQFCKEQRLRTTELMRESPDLNKTELNRVLCNQWKTMNQEDKKVYYDKYELEKQQYSLELEIYDRQKGLMGSLPSELFDLP
ncbi:uncharacterized protein LOC135938440 [Cloeon dipterum]|uniref:uncharacterized protein LOC135938440 n=1 Tax=Cloeon dipterum TaxID=197152 RepID=UPI00321FDD7E